MTVNGNKVSGAVKRGVLSVILTQIVNDRDVIELEFSGLDTSDFESQNKIEWHKSKLKHGDQITIKVLDIGKISKPIEIRGHKGEPMSERQKIKCKIK